MSETHAHNGPKREAVLPTAALRALSRWVKRLTILRSTPRAHPTSGRATERDLRMMRRALELARTSAAADEVPVGAVVYRGDEIIAEAHNLREAVNDPTGHAELMAIRRAAERLKTWRLSDCSLAVTLEPCPMCAGAIVQARLGRLVYGATDPKAGAVHTLYNLCSDRRLNHSVEIIAGVLAEEAGDLLKAFFRRRRAEKKADRDDDRPPSSRVRIR
ncbi:MAG: tRNA adenosine(34) deaminase TadA [Phycisphaerales bacterium]|nr:tRNA adenosine(34) deaminase TadA [Phycisphaerales bacterium]